MLNYIPKYEVLCSSNATWQYQGKGGFGWLGGPCRARGGWERQLEPGGPVVMAREQGNGLGSAVRCFWIFYLLVPNPNRRRKMCIKASSPQRGQVCPTSRPFTIPNRASLGFGVVAETFIAYLGPRFLHVPLLQVVSRELWHQLEQPSRREMRAQHHWRRLGDTCLSPPTPLPPDPNQVVGNSMQVSRPHVPQWADEVFPLVFSIWPI